jgi:hypothetical protein
MKTASEAAFETFLGDNKLSFQKLEEQDSPRPDYLVQIGDLKVIFEVKELAEDKNFKTEPLQVSHRILGDHIRSKISDARKQVQFGARQGIPSVLLVYNNLDPIHLFGTEEPDFISAMYGAYTVLIDRGSMRAVDYFYGEGQSLQEERNTSFSAVGRLYPVRERLEVTLFENVFAAIKIPLDALPSCFDVKRVEITGSENM